MKNSIYQTEGISLTQDVKADLADLCSDFQADKIFVLLDENTHHHCWPLIQGFVNLDADHIFIIKPGEENKKISVVERVWEFLGERRADRKSLLVNIGGGMLTDLGGFAAGTFKRGIDFINIPTTLLAMVDASVGGKTGVNFRGLKNEVGMIRMPTHVFLHVPFLRTLDEANYRSGFAEMLKAGLICDDGLWQQLKNFDLHAKDEGQLSELIWQAVMIKKDVVDRDPAEKGDRKALNFGHTIGHALESLTLEAGKPLLHGYAVAYGMILEAQLSQILTGLGQDAVVDIRETINRIYGLAPAEIRNQQEMLNRMRFDKKNERNRINFTLLNQIGSFSINHYTDEEKIMRVLSSAVIS